jgi:type I restriction enzyme, S subunit
MRLSYRKLGPYIQQVDKRNSQLEIDLLLGVSIQKMFMPSIANTEGTDFTKYKIVKKGQFTYIPDTSRRGDKIGIALLENHEVALVSQAYTVFEITDLNSLDPEYLMMWFRRPEFDRYARFKSHGSVREIFDWEEMCEVELPIPSIDKQREIVAEYNTVVNRIQLNEQLNQNLEETAQALYKHWFSGNSQHKTITLTELIEFNPKETIPKGRLTSYVEMANLQENAMSITSKIMRSFDSGSKFRNGDTLLARITPCLENGKTSFVNCLQENEIGFGSTEFITLRPKGATSKYWTYCLARDENFRKYAISSMVGSSGRERVSSSYLEAYEVPDCRDLFSSFDEKTAPIFKIIHLKSLENNQLDTFKELLLSQIASI